MLLLVVLAALGNTGINALTAEELAVFYNGVTLTEADGAYTMEASGLPDHATDDFPNDYNPNTISAQNHSMKISSSPRPLEGGTGCLPMGTIGLAINGVALFNPYTANGQNAVEGEFQELFDDCAGHPQMQGAYHYHKISSCLQESIFNSSAENEGLFGVALDGYPIYVTRDGNKAGLDECNGMFVGDVYRYYATNDFPYLLGCYKGEVIDESIINHMPPPGGQMPPPGGQMPPPGGQMPPPGGQMPPPGGQMPPPDGQMPPPGGQMPPPGGQMGGNCYHADVAYPEGFADLREGTLNVVSGAEYTATSAAVLMILLPFLCALILF